MLSTEMKSLKEIENLSVLQKTEYYRALRTYCEKNVDRKPVNPFTRRIMYLLGRLIRAYEFEMRGCENIPKDDSVIFVCNHSNSHDFFNLTEAFVKLRKKVTPLAAWDGLNWFSRLLFKMGNITFITI